MSALTLDSLTLPALALAFLAAFTGSLHCVGMCGPLRLLAGDGRFVGARYQAGRLLAYLLLGGLAGAAGAAVPLWLLFSLVGTAILFHLLQIRLFPGLEKWRHTLLLAASTRPALIGFVSGLLPCGMLHAWIGVAAVSQNLATGALMLGLLWAGTLPALELGSRALRAPLTRLRARFPRVLPILLLLLSLIPIGLRQGLSLSESETAGTGHCHESPSPADHGHHH